LSGTSQVAGSPGAKVHNDQLLSSATSQPMANSGQYASPCRTDSILAGQHLGEAQRRPARNDSHLVDRVGIFRCEEGHQHATRLVIGRDASVRGTDDEAASLATQHHLVVGYLEIALAHLLCVAPCGTQCCLVDQILDVGPRKADGAASRDLEIHDFRQRQPTAVDFEDRQPACGNRTRDHHLS